MQCDFKGSEVPFYSIFQLLCLPALVAQQVYVDGRHAGKEAETVLVMCILSVVYIE